MGGGGLPEYVAHKPTKRGLFLVAAVAVALPLLGLFYMSGVVWSRHIITNAADVVATQRRSFGNTESGMLSLSSSSGGSRDSTHSCMPVMKLVPPPKTRQDIGLMLQHEGLEVGAELGVHQAIFAAETLSVWPSCKRYYLVDPYSPEPEAAGSATPTHTHTNQKQRHSQQQQQEQRRRQEELMREAQENLQTQKNKLVWLRNSTATAARLIREPLDYVYLSLSRDYCSVLADLQAWWPLVKPSGVMAGLNYENAVDVMRQHGKDWSRCPDGTIHQGAVQAAVNDFFAQQGLQIVVTYRETAWNSWVVRKPYYPCQQASGAAGNGVGGDAPLTQLLSKMLQQTPQQQQLMLAQQQSLLAQQQQQQAESPPLTPQQQQEDVAGQPLLLPQQGEEQQDSEAGGVQPAEVQQLGEHQVARDALGQQRQQLHAALLKLQRDSQGVAASRARQQAEAAAESSSSPAGVPPSEDVFGDIFSMHETEQRHDLHPTRL